MAPIPARSRRLECDLVEAGASVAQRVAERVGELFEHGMHLVRESSSGAYRMPRRGDGAPSARRGGMRRDEVEQALVLGRGAGSWVTYCSDPQSPHFDQLPTSLYWFMVSPPAATHWP